MQKLLDSGGTHQVNTDAVQLDRRMLRIWPQQHSCPDSKATMHSRGLAWLTPELGATWGAAMQRKLQQQLMLKSIQQEAALEQPGCRLARPPRAQAALSGT